MILLPVGGAIGCKPGQLQICSKVRSQQVTHSG